MAGAMDGFEDRLDKAISDLEDALLGISDDEIKNVLRDKGYAAVDENEFLHFKDHLKEAVLDRLIENHRQEDAGSSETGEVVSPDFDISCSSYMKIASENNKEDITEDIQKLLAVISMSSEDSYPCLSEDTEDSLKDLLESNPELQQPLERVEQGQRRKFNSNDDGERQKLKRRRAQSFSESQNAHKKFTSAEHETFEQFVRRECRMQMDLITGSRQSNWVPTRPRCSPQVRYHQYRKFWEKFPVPGEKPRKELRWAIRNQMAKKEEPHRMSWWPEIKLPST